MTRTWLEIGFVCIQLVAVTGLLFALGCMSSANLVEPASGDGGPDGDADTDVDADSDTDTGSEPVVVEVPFDSNPTIPHDLKKNCTEGPDSNESTKTCPIIQWNGFNYWAYSYQDNTIAMGIVAYGTGDVVLKRVNGDGARYLWDITIESDAQTATLHGQGGNTIVLNWAELLVTETDKIPDGWLCDPVYYGWEDGCDCGCGEPDPDCGGGGCTPPSCIDPSCEFCFDEEIQPITCEIS